MRRWVDVRMGWGRHRELQGEVAGRENILAFGQELVLVLVDLELEEPVFEEQQEMDEFGGEQEGEPQQQPQQPQP